MQTRKPLLKYVGLLCLIIVFGLDGTASGQLQRRALPDSNQIAILVDTLAAKLSLSDSVKTKVNEIYFASFAELNKEMAGNRGDFRAIRDTRRDITEKHEKDIKMLLNDNQREAFEKLIEEERSRMRDRMRGRRGRF